MVASGSLVDVQRDSVRLGTSGYFGHVQVGLLARWGVARGARLYPGGTHRARHASCGPASIPWPALNRPCLAPRLAQMEDFLEALVGKVRGAPASLPASQAEDSWRWQPALQPMRAAGSMRACAELTGRRPLPLLAPAAQLHSKGAALDKYRRQHVPRGVPPPLPPGAPLSVNRM